MSNKDAQRQAANLAFLQSGAEFRFGDERALPLPAAVLAALGPHSPGVEAVLAGGLTALVYCLRVDGRRYAVKRARPECLVRNADGRTSFLNELQRHAELRALRERGAVFPGVVAPLFGSLRLGLLVSPWVDGVRIETFDRRRLDQLFATGRALLEHGFFEWDFSPGNLLDDGSQTWLFDFGYMYRFDPLREFNSAGNGSDAPQFHLAERIETRAAFAWLLRMEQEQGLAAAQAGFALLKQVAAAHFTAHRALLAERGAESQVLAMLDATLDRWRRTAPDDLYLLEAWRSHTLDLFDDLHGRTCTPGTLARADWLLAQAFTHFGRLHELGALAGEDAACTRDELQARYRGHRASAERYQLGQRAA